VRRGKSAPSEIAQKYSSEKAGESRKRLECGGASPQAMGLLPVGTMTDPCKLNGSGERNWRTYLADADVVSPTPPCQTWF